MNYLCILAENPEDIPTCNVNEKIYNGGEYFIVESDPDLICVCQSGYEGKSILNYFFTLSQIF